MTPQQKACLDAIRHLTKDGVSPSLEELRVELGLAAKSGVHRLLVSLEEQGRVRRAFGRARRLEVVEEATASARPTIDPDKVALALIAERLLPLTDRSRAAKIIAGVLG